MDFQTAATSGGVQRTSRGAGSGCWLWETVLHVDIFSIVDIQDFLSYIFRSVLKSSDEGKKNLSLPLQEIGLQSAHGVGIR
jgi:hypothetical protein